MNKYLIEVPHESEAVACCRAVQILLRTGSHFLTRAEFGCNDGVHKAWLVVEVEDKDAARRIIPPAYRASATVVQLNRFTIEEIETLLGQHEPPAGDRP